jgi:hypothetical protein
MPGECRQKTDLKAHHLKSIAECDKLVSLQGISLVAHDWQSMTSVIQNMGDITLFWVINVLLQNGVTTNRIVHMILVQLREISLCFLVN